MRFAFIDAWNAVWPVEFLCRVMRVTSRGFRAWKVRPMSQRQRGDMAILSHTREQHRPGLQSYGRPRMTEELNELRLNVGHRRIGRLMQATGIRIVRTRKYKATTDSSHAFNNAPKLLEQDFSANGPKQKWAEDIFYIWTGERWLYLAVIRDLYSRRVIALSWFVSKPLPGKRWAVSNRMKRDLAIRALDMAVALRQPPVGCIHHTERGSQYCSNEDQRRLSNHGFLVSMSGKGNCQDNSLSADFLCKSPVGLGVVETFFKSLKAEVILRNRWETRRQAEGAIFQYMNGFDNPHRRHSELGGSSPLAFERWAA